MEREKPKDLYVGERGRSSESMAVRKPLMWVACLQPRAMVMLDLAVVKGLVWVCGPDVVVVICVNV